MLTLLPSLLESAGTTRRCGCRRISTSVGVSRPHALRLDAGVHRLRKSKPELEPRRVVEHFDASTMKSGHGGHNAEPETISGNVATPFEPIEALEYVRV